RIGSAEFTGFREKLNSQASYVFVAVGDDARGYFTIQASVRQHIKSMLQRLGNLCAALLSGDNSSDTQTMTQLFPAGTQLRFEQRPTDKMEFIAGLQREGKKVLMLGDGLNDAGALKQADVGIAVTDDTGLFTPGCDGILQGHQLQNLDQFLALAHSSSRILKIAFGISFFYNVIALTFAVTGHLTPLVAAILMPVSSVSVVGFASVAVNYVARKKIKTLSI
ncbi:MAG: HAD-IC family P-type ATPase, partial [Bacteroidota bacterium]